MINSHAKYNWKRFQLIDDWAKDTEPLLKIMTKAAIDFQAYQYSQLVAHGYDPKRFHWHVYKFLSDSVFERLLFVKEGKE